MLKNKNAIDEIVENGYRDYKEKFSVEPNVKKLTQIYSQVIANKKHQNNCD